jgi:uncharacterized protein involved in response to NO
MPAMNATILPAPAPAALLRTLAAAPHRLLFFVGAANVLLAMAWWAAWLLDARWHVLGLAQPVVPAGWLHAFVMQYQLLPAFFFGFLLTVYPRWMNLPAPTRWHYVPVGAGLFGGQLLTLLGALGAPPLLYAGLGLTLAGWIVAFALLLRLVWLDAARTWHAVSILAALGFGLFGMGLFVAHVAGGDARLAFASIKIGSFGLLLPVYVTVAHRMFPFFAGNVVPGYKPWRPLPWLAAFWCGVLVHLGLELVHGYAWLWVVDAPLLALCGHWLWRNWPMSRMDECRGGQDARERPRARIAPVPPLLRVLFLGFAWLPVALALYVVQSAWYALDGNFMLGRAPAHALFVGFFGSLLVAMVTRVTQGHSGRPLELGRIPAIAFVLLQGVALLRIAAEVLPDSLAWQGAAAVGWLLAFAPWVVRSLGIYARPRADGKPG